MSIKKIRDKFDQLRKKYEGVKMPIEKIGGKFDQLRKYEWEKRVNEVMKRLEREYILKGEPIPPDLRDRAEKLVGPFRSSKDIVRDTVKSVPTALAASIALAPLSGKRRTEKLWEMARGRPEIYQLLAKPTPYQIFGEFLFVLAIVLWLGGNLPLAFALGAVGFLILSFYTSYLLVASVLPICLLVYLLWFGPIPTLLTIGVGILFILSLIGALFIMLLAIATRRTVWKFLGILLAIGIMIGSGAFWAFTWSPGYPDWLREVNIPLAGTTPNAYLQQKLPIPPNLITILGWVIVLLTFHYTYSSILASPTFSQDPGGAFFGNILIVTSIFLILGIDWIEIGKTITGVAGPADFYSCLMSEFASPENIAKGINPWAKCEEIVKAKRVFIPIHKFGSYSFPIQMKLTPELLGITPTPIPRDGGTYSLFFTVINTGEKEIENIGLWVNNFTGYCSGDKVSPLVCDVFETEELCEKSIYCNWVDNECVGKPCSEFNETLCKLAVGCKWDYKKEDITPTCDWKPAETLRVGETRCNAKVYIPPEYSSYTPEVKVSFEGLETQGVEKVRVLESYDYYDRYYKPVCLTAEGKDYYCSATTEGPVDPIIAFIPRQYVHIIEGGLPLTLIIRISNENGGGTAVFESIEIEGLERLIWAPPEKCRNPLQYLAVKGKRTEKLEQGEIADDIICEITPVNIKPPTRYYEETINIKAKYNYNQTYTLTTIHEG